MHSTPLTRASVRGAARPQIDGLTGIRALAAAWVVVEHYRQPLFELFPGTLAVDKFVEAGYLGVEVFFVLSGFIIAYTYAQQFEQFSWPRYRRFMLLRFARIYPVHLVLLLVVLGLVIAAGVAGVSLNSGGKYTAGNFLANVVMLQTVPPFSAWNGPAWSVCVEFAAYFAFPVVAIWLARVQTARHGFIAAGLILICGSGLMLVTAKYVNSSPTSYELIWLRISTEFTAGALIYAGWRHLEHYKKGPWWDKLAMGALASVLGVIAITGGDSAYALASVPFIGLFILSCAGATGWVGSLLGCRLMIWGGKVSYSVYMTHFVLLMMFGKLLPWEAFSGSELPLRIGVMGAYYASVIIAGATCYYLVEEPARRAIRSATEGRFQGPPPKHPAPML